MGQTGTGSSRFNPGASLPKRRRSIFPLVVLVLIIAFFGVSAWWVVGRMSAPPDATRATLVFDICNLPAPLTIEDQKWEVTSTDLTQARLPAGERSTGFPGSLAFTSQDTGTFTADVGGTATLQRVPDGAVPEPSRC